METVRLIEVALGGVLVVVALAMTIFSGLTTSYLEQALGKANASFRRVGLAYTDDELALNHSILKYAFPALVFVVGVAMVLHGLLS